MKDDKIEKKDLFHYTFHDDSGNLCVVLNVENIKKMFNADIVLLEENEHR